MQRYIERMRRRMGGVGRLAAGLLAGALLAALLLPLVGAQGLVTYKNIDGGSYTQLTRELEPGGIVGRAALAAGFHDEVVYTQKAPGVFEATIREAFPVQVEADGSRQTVQFVDGTVADLLAEAGVELAGEDFVEPALDTPLAEGMEAVVHRVTYTTEDTRGVVDEAKVDAYMAQNLLENPDSLFRKSNAGVYDVTYTHRLVDGEIESSQVEHLIPIITPRPEGSLDFTPGVPISRIEGYDDIPLAENGLPAEYSRKISAVCTAYSASGGRGSSGLGLYYGTCAVNPNVIPYGTRMYITSPDESFVYGYAIATDTGTAMMEGHVDLDLFFETYGESVRFGKRALDVYILD